MPEVDIVSQFRDFAISAADLLVKTMIGDSLSPHRFVMAPIPEM